MQDYFLLIMFLIAVILGWLLGRVSKKTGSEHSAHQEFSEQYYKGLNYLLNEQPDEAIDTFIQTLEVNNNTLETHLALGNMMRRKGETDRAIRIHQNLLARSGLSKQKLHQAHLELARDYISAGLLDRAERLLGDLVSEAPELREVSLWHLLEVYQNEKDWDKAIETAKALTPGMLTRPSGQLSMSSAHFFCELAIKALGKKDFRQARGKLKQAFVCDKSCVRASLLAGQLEYEVGKFKQSIKCLKKIRTQDPDFVPESLPLLRQCYHQLDDMLAYLEYLYECNQQHPSVTEMLEIATVLGLQKDPEQAERFIADQLKSRPSLRGLRALIEIHIAHANGRAKDNLSLLLGLIQRLIASKPVYRCVSCGFSGKQLHWFCPGCKQWGTVKPIQGLEGD